MNVLILNCGSSTIKFRLYRVSDAQSSIIHSTSLASGVAEVSGPHCGLTIRVDDRLESVPSGPMGSHVDAALAILNWLESSGILQGQALTAVAHRIVHGGARFSAPVFIQPDTIALLDQLAELAPNHNHAAVAVVRTCLDVLGSQSPMVAVFDTAFHHSLPDCAALYAIPLELSEQLAIRRFGFHGLAHRDMVERGSTCLGIAPARFHGITLQLGNGCSAAAIREGRSVDTTMGLTPLEGLMMGTRCGNVDPALVGYLMRHRGLSLSEVEECLNRQSGLLGVSGLCSDMRTLLAARQQGHSRATLAIELFCYRVRQSIGAYLATLGAVEVLVFGGGIGERAAEIRSLICQGLEWAGIEIDPERNRQTVDTEGFIHAPQSRVRVLVARVNEEALILRDTMSALTNRGSRF